MWKSSSCGAGSDLRCDTSGNWFLGSSGHRYWFKQHGAGGSATMAGARSCSLQFKRAAESRQIGCERGQQSSVAAWCAVLSEEGCWLGLKHLLGGEGLALWGFGVGLFWTLGVFCYFTSVGKTTSLQLVWEQRGWYDTWSWRRDAAGNPSGCGAGAVSFPARASGAGGDAFPSP